MRPERRGRLGGGRRPGAQGHRRPAHLRLRRHRPHAGRRGGPGGGDLPPPVPGRPGAREGGRPLLRRPGRGHRPRAKRKIIGELFIRIFEEVAQDLGAGGQRAALPGPRDAVPRRHRVRRRRGRRPGGQHQVPPQRGRSARGPGLRPGRAPAPAVQGRGPGRRRGAGPAPRHRLAPALPRARPGRAHHRRGDARAGRDPAGGRRRGGRGGPQGRPVPQLWQSFAVLPAVRTVG